MTVARLERSPRTGSSNARAGAAEGTSTSGAGAAVKGEKSTADLAAPQAMDVGPSADQQARTSACMSLTCRDNHTS